MIINVRSSKPVSFRVVFYIAIDIPCTCYASFNHFMNITEEQKNDRGSATHLANSKKLELN